VSQNTITIAVDGMGGDHAPGVVLEGADIALSQDPDIKVLLVGPDEVVTEFASGRPRVEPLLATEVIGMSEHPATAIRSKRDSSIVVGARSVKEQQAEAFFSAGSTGAMMAACTLGIGRISGVLRPAIAAVLPTSGSPTILLDVGANADCKPEYLLQFAIMGSAYASSVLDVTDPSVALLNIGEEDPKGSQLAQSAYALMRDKVHHFIGNVEGHQVPAGVIDVVVTDGFTGNVALKLIEGTSIELFEQLRRTMASSILRKGAAAVLRPALRELKRRLDPDVYGGAPLLGVNGLALIGHGSSTSKAIAAGIHAAAKGVRQDVIGSISRAIEESP